MSEKSTNDTSQQHPTTTSSSATLLQQQQRIVKNPLLSAHVTGLTFDDYPNKPLLLPAAPPIVHAPAPVPPAAALLSREPKSLVTVGSSSNLDSESLDEINLNSIGDQRQTQPQQTQQQFDTFTNDANANQIWEQHNVNNNDSILSQAASSFSALPSVASSVFSTFSKRIYAGSSSSRERTPLSDSAPPPVADYNQNQNPLQQQFDVTTSQQQQTFYQPQPLPPTVGGNYFEGVTAPPTSAVQPTAVAAPPSEPPKFYTPSEVPPPSAAPLPPPSSVGANTFRLSAKKKIYAPIPGLSDTSQPLAAPFSVEPSAFAAAPPLPTDHYNTPYPSTDSQTFQQQQQQYPTPSYKPEERKAGGGLFSLTSGVLQNLTGLVQSAAGTLTGSPAANPPPQEQQQYTASGVNVNLFGASADGTHPPPLPGNFYSTTAVDQTNFFAAPPSTAYTSSGPPAQSPAAFFNAGPIPLATSQSPPNPTIFTPCVDSATVGAPTATVASVTSFLPPPIPQPQPAAVSLPTQFLPPSAGGEAPLRPPSASGAIQQTAANPLQPPPLLAAFAQPNVQQLFTPSLPPNTTTTTEPNRPPSAVGIPQQPPLISTQAAVLPPPTQQSEPPPASGIFATPQSLPPQASLPSCAAANPLQAPPIAANPPPPPSTGSTSFRLQKGTRLYKSPLTSAETAPSYAAAPPTLGLTPATDTASSFYNPFNQVAPPLGETPEAPQTHSVPSYFLPTSSEPQSVPLFVAEDKRDTEIETPSKQQPVEEEESETKSSILEPLSESLLAEQIIEPVIPDEDKHTAPLELAVQQLALQTQPQPEVAEVEQQQIESKHYAEPFQAGRPQLTSIPLERTIEGTGSLLPPPAFGQATTEATGLSTTNPYRKEPPSLHNFFTPLAGDDIKGAGDFNFFAPPPIEKLTERAADAVSFFGSQTSHHVAQTTEPRAAALEAPRDADTHIAPPPIGFENIESAVRQSETVSTSVAAVTENTFSNFFNRTSSVPETQNHTQAEYRQPKDPHTFFDTFAGTGQPGEASAPVTGNTHTESSFFQAAPTEAEPQQQQQQQNQETNTSPQRNEYQRIQNFFNNPPPKEENSSTGDLNYDLVHSGLGVKNLQQRSLTPASNLVEPPSSSCSEFSLTAPKAAETSASSVTCDSGADTTPTVKHYEELPEEILQELRKMAKSEKDATTSSSNATPMAVPYTPAVKHWFYKRVVSSKYVWTPFSHYDNALLETTLTMGANAPNIVAVEGGRYDVNIQERRKTPVYWDSEPIEVRRCSWFFKGADSKYVPYEEETADQLEAEYKLAVEKNDWHKKIILSQGEQVVFHGATVIVHFLQQQNADAWGGSSQITTRPRMVKRDLDDFQIEQGESQRVDHLLLMVHGIGAACDLKMRTVEEVVDEFRSIAQQLVTSHYKNSTDLGVVGRVEVLPISWHFHLHSAEMGIDEKLKSITLESIPKLRNFTNDTLLDVLFYTSPTYCQKIMNTVAQAMNGTYEKYRERHPDFSGGVSLAGHSLGSLILFDLLCHQHPIKELEDGNLENPDQPYGAAHEQLMKITNPPLNAVNSHEEQVAYTMGPAGTGQPFIHYTQLAFQPKKFFALGSPIGMFVTIRGIDKLGFDFRLPTCPGFYNIFHPFDPVAYRIEALINPDMSGVRPVLIPHHKGRKRMHLELKETMTRVGADLKQRFLDTVKTTIGSVNFLGTSPSTTRKDEESMKEEVEKVLTMQMQLEHQDNSVTQQLTRNRTDSLSTVHSDEMVEIDLPLGKLNDSKRVDYVLQEAPLEFFNEYLFALSSHVCYWDSEDTILFVMKEIYAGLGISPDSQVPQQSMTIERPNSRNGLS